MQNLILGDSSLLWKPLFEAAGQTIVGAVGAYSFQKVMSKILQRNTFNGAMDVWLRGIRGAEVREGDEINIDGTISPYTQLFPGDPYENARRWNPIYEVPGEMSSGEYQALEFVASGDAALRTGALNGECVVGIFGQFGYVGEGLVGVAPSTVVRKAIPDFFHDEFVAARALIRGTLARCPSQHGFVVQAIAERAGIALDTKSYRNLWYVKIAKIKPYMGQKGRNYSLLGSPWAATSMKDRQYLVQYGYMNDRREKKECLQKIVSAAEWKRAQVYFDDMTSPSKELSFRRIFVPI